MSMRGDRSDQYVQQALEYALRNKPCVISCRTVKAIEAVYQDLTSLGLEARIVRVSTPAQARVTSINLFEAGLIDYLVVSSQLLYVAPLRFRRVGCHLASADALIPYRITAFQLLLGPTKDAVDRVFAPKYQRAQQVTQ